MPECQITNKVNKERKTHIDVYCSFLEGKRHQSLAKPDKIKFLNELKRTEPAKQKHGVNTIHANICVTFDMSFATPLQTALLYFKKNSFIEHSI